MYEVVRNALTKRFFSRFRLGDSTTTRTFGRTSSHRIASPKTSHYTAIRKYIYFFFDYSRLLPSTAPRHRGLCTVICDTLVLHRHTHRCKIIRQHCTDPGERVLLRASRRWCSMYRKITMPVPATRTRQSAFLRTERDRRRGSAGVSAENFDPTVSDDPTSDSRSFKSPGIR